MPWKVQFLVDISKQFDWVELPVLLLQLLAPVLGQYILFQETPVRSSGGIIHLVDSGTLAMLFLELHHRLEEVHVALYQGVESVQLGESLLGLVAVIGHQSSNYRPVLLLHMGIVFLLAGSGAGEGDALLLTVGKEVVVDELAAVVRVQPQQGEGQVLADVTDGAAHPLLALAHDGAAGHPTGGDVHGAKGVEVLALDTVAAVSHQVYFQKAGLVLIPFSEGADGDGGLEERPRLGGGEGFSQLSLTMRTEQPVDSGSAHGGHLILDPLFQDRFPVAFQDLHQLWEEGLQPLGTYPVAGFPQSLQGGSGLETIAPGSSHFTPDWASGLCPQGLDPGLAMQTGDPYSFVQNAALFAAIAMNVSDPYSVQILFHPASCHVTLR